MSPEQETLAVQCVANVRCLVARGIVARRDGKLEPAATSLQPDTHPSTTRQRLAGAYDLPRSALRDDPTGLVQRKAKPFWAFGRAPGDDALSADAGTCRPYPKVDLEVVSLDEPRRRLELRERASKDLLRSGGVATVD